MAGRILNALLVVTIFCGSLAPNGRSKDPIVEQAISSLPSDLDLADQELSAGKGSDESFDGFCLDAASSRFRAMRKTLGCEDFDGFSSLHHVLENPRAPPGC